MSYAVKEIFKTLQGEGAQMGRAAVFCRFAGCNLWSGREGDRATSVCTFCDTDFVGMDGSGGGRFADDQALADAIESEWAGARADRYVVLTGGEPLLQVDQDLVDALHTRGFEIAIETNGTQPAPRGLDWICVSPKADAELVLLAGNELKLVYPQEKAAPERFEHLAFEHFFLQPMDSPTAAANLEAAITYCTQNPRWRLSLQSHKMIGIR
ncbi:7-carboxy-7-deazaguanine synthase [Sphingomonas histidinilytica]|uniref:7-carboxy-7-deazaguanine synthase n=1 Tax=Rhizorhabdus histidinilytica TaxID=439228 RepID=UPI001ADCEDEA|nr:7-carboxy-7-deazaguanine synthase [Rhizorhabdus histidinilytica]MBO9376951.1 7-carboxy-7-deazaguanine synthase [Rhizorhabdus histidinilytica]